MTTPILPDIVDEAERLVARAHEQAVLLRLIGGLAVRLHAEGGVNPAFAREYADIDLVTTRKGSRAAGRLLAQLGYEPNERFNAMNGDRRLVFYDLHHERHIDVFVDEFHMCHTIPITDRLHLDERTVPLAELLLTKLQIVRLNEKDLDDIWTILAGHEVAEHDDDAVNAKYVAGLLASDWGLWRTTRQTIETARGRLGTRSLSDSDRLAIDSRLARLWERIEAHPKSVRWRGRARLGERAKWFEEPEEIAHGTG